MPNLEWGVPHSIVTPAGTLVLNTPDTSVTPNRIWQILPDEYKIVPSMRVTQDAKSQADGSVLHPRFKTGLVATLKVRYSIGDGSGEVAPACQSDLRVMHEILGGLVNSIRQDGLNQRLLWTPSGYAGGPRMLDNIQLLSWPDPSIEDELLYDVAFSVESPFPYAIDFAQTDTVISDGGSFTIVNAGNAEFFPVFKVYGPGAGSTSNFTLQNNDTGLAIVYNAALPGAVAIGAGQYVEIDTFKGTAFLNGSGADLIAGIDPALSDFWPLQPTAIGDNDVAITGGDVHVLWNNAWV